LLTGPTGLGHTGRAGALGHPAGRDGSTGLSLRLPRLRPARPMAKGDGRDPTLMAALATTACLLLDDWGLATLRAEPRRDIRALLEDRHGQGAPMGTSQCPVAHGPQALGAPPLADAMLDRRLHNASKLPLRGAAMRKRHAVVQNDVPTPSPDPPRRRCAPLGDRWGAAFVRLGWQASCGCGGRFAPAWVAGITGIRSLPSRVVP